jgi:hypothetical protein
MRNLLLVVAIVGCGGGSGSGIDGNKKLADLTVAELNEECNYAYETYPEVTITCPDGSTKHKGQTGTQSTDCAATKNDVPATCPVTVSQVETCFADSYDESDAAVCAGTVPPSCAPLLSCGA